MARIKHIALSSEDPVKTAAFYQSVFGLSELHRKPEDTGDEGVWLTDGYIYFAILKHGSHGAPNMGEGASTVPGVHHIGFYVDDLEEACKTIEAAEATLGILDECRGELDPKKQIQHVIRESKKLSDSANGPGQARIPETAWPFIQLYDFEESSTVQILYSTEFEKQVANLFFDTTDELIITSLDRKTYLLNMPVFVTIQDPMLNIDPTDEDSWTFGTRPGSESSYYQLFDENGETLADGTSGAVELSKYLNSMMFEDNGLMTIFPDTNGIGVFAVNLVDNEIQEIIGEDITTARTVKDTIPKGFQPITFVETGPNTGIFVNSDAAGISNLVTTMQEGLTSAAIHYPEDESEKIIVELPVEIITEPEPEPVIVPAPEPEPEPVTGSEIDRDPSQLRTVLWWFDSSL